MGPNRRIMMLKLYLKSIDRSLPSSMQSRIAHDLLFSLGIVKNGEKIIKGRFGKPYIEGSGTFFNISHTDGAIAIAVSDAEVGVDIQSLRMISDAAMRRFVGELPPPDPILRTRLWTRCESHAKWLSCGLPTTIPDREHVFFEYDFQGIPVCVCTSLEITSCEVVYLDEEGL